jgi:hypothetical protein
MHDQRVIVWAAFGGENFFDGFGIGGVGAEAVDGFGGEGDETACAQRGYGAGDVCCAGFMPHREVIIKTNGYGLGTMACCQDG